MVHAFWRIHPDVKTLADLKQFAREGFDKYFQRLVEMDDAADDGEAKDYLESAADVAADEGKLDDDSGSDVEVLEARTRMEARARRQVKAEQHDSEDDYYPSS